MGIVSKIHHVAYRCKDAKETVEWYRKYLDMDLVLAIAEDQVPSTKDPDPYMHIFLDAGGGNVLAFFELPTKPPMSRDPNTPIWTQHLAFEIGDAKYLTEVKDRMQADGIEVIGPIEHTIFKSIYFYDPNGHRLELAFNTATQEMKDKLDAVKWDMVEEWARTKKAPKHAAWMHEAEFRG